MLLAAVSVYDFIEEIHNSLQPRQVLEVIDAHLLLLKLANELRGDPMNILQIDHSCLLAHHQIVDAH